jgi:membrane fusion protein, heavy metal efflux system
MKNINFLFILASICALTSGPILAAQDTHAHEENVGHEDHEEAGQHEEGDQHGEHGESESAHVEISASMAEQTGIRIREASGGTLVRTLVSYGRLALDPDSIVHIRARFPGQIVNVNAGLGDSVEAGDLLITVESNDSLQTYTVTAPVDGTVLERNASHRSPRYIVGGIKNLSGPTPTSGTRTDGPY